MPWDKETARAAAAKSAEVRRRKRDLTPQQRAQAKAAAASEEAMRDLISAAKGEGDFKDLEVAKRVEAIKSVLLYGLGRPANTAKPDTPIVEPEENVTLV